MGPNISQDTHAKEGEVAVSDMRVIVRLLGEAASLAGGLPEKKCLLLDGLCDFAGAAEWRWAIFTHLGRQPAKCLVAVRRRLGRSHRLPADPGRKELSSSRFVPPMVSSPQTILSKRDLDDGTESRIALCRPKHAFPYTARESQVASMILEEIPWLHWREWNRESGVSKLTPRQRLTLDLLLLGLGRKEIAARIGISTGTVSGYMRELYQYFGVKFHAELLRGQRLAGSQPQKRIS